MPGLEPDADGSYVLEMLRARYAPTYGAEAVRFVELLSPLHPALRAEWAEVALRWALGTLGLTGAETLVHVGDARPSVGVSEDSRARRLDGEPAAVLEHDALRRGELVDPLLPRRHA